MESKSKGRGKAVARSFGNIVILLAIFLVGVNVGNGRIDLHKPRSQNGNLPSRLNYSAVNDVYQSLKNSYDGKLNETQLEDGLKHGLATATKDPYTEYFTAKEAQDFNGELNNSFSGIGAQLGQDKEGNLEVIAPIDGLPAQKAGLQAKDIIATINGQPTTDMSVDEAVSKIRGHAGTQVKLQVVRNRAKTLDLAITRQDINLPSVKTKILDGNIGYLQITTFSNDTNELAGKAAVEFKNKQVKGVILDLRNNPGGLLDGAVRVSSLWLDRGKLILQEKRGGEVVDSNSASGGNMLDNVPTVVLINSGSASASEITAGALHDNQAAYLIGEKSYGKGVVQQLINFRDGSQLKVTVASWYRPSGQNINKQGIKPDQTVKLTDDDRQAGKDPQLDAAQAHLNK
jgi:carboxyl-terminal processing protease